MDIYTLLFLVIAVVLIFRLRSVLGRRTGSERPPAERRVRRNSTPDSAASKVVQLPARSQNRSVEPPPPPEAELEPVKMPSSGQPALDAALTQMMRADPGFSGESFLGGAKIAYEMIVGAFAAGDRKALKPLLSKEVFDDFDHAISEREKQGHSVESTFVGFDTAQISEASLRGNNGQISVHFVAKVIQATRDKAGEIVNGDPAKVVEITDNWTFARDLASRDPNWRLIATEAA